MKKSLTIFIVAASAFCMRAEAASLPVKLPYAKGQEFVVTQGYDTPPTHIKKDAYALDLTQNGCDAYGKAAVAAAAGKVMFLSQRGYNGGYGTELIIDHGNNIVSRYAHMVPDSITVAPGSAILRGETVGLIGDTGLVAGLACALHPGTHLHFAMDIVAHDGTFLAYDPEPISGYINMTVGKWYLSDNSEDYGAGEEVASNVGNTTTLSSTNNVISIPAPSTPASSSIISVPPSPAANVGVSAVGGVSVIPASEYPPATGSSSSSVAVMPPAPPAAPATGTIFEQSDDSTVSGPSWYDDNWFELGNGFSGTLTDLTLEGAVSDRPYFASHITLEEFKDKNYTAMVQDFPISDNAPFSNSMATATFAGLSIPLKPYFYYRIATDQDYQNRSVVLAGTATTTIGTAMHDGFIYGTGRVEFTSPFFPFMVMEGTLATSTLSPPPLTSPGNITENFNPFGMQLAISWSTSTDPDWPANPLQYQMNYSTSTVFSDDGWISPAPFTLLFGNTYLIGLRAVDNYGNVSAITTTTWNFPAGFVPYLLSPGLGYAYQYFTVPATSTLQSIELFTTNLRTSAHYVPGIGCSLQLFDEDDLSSLGMTPSDNGFGGLDCEGSITFSFASSALVLHPDHRYHWVFNATTGNPSTGAAIQFYGTATNTAGGLFGDPSLVNAKFTVTGDSGVLFSN